jgi:TldD protein
MGEINLPGAMADLRLRLPGMIEAMQDRLATASALLSRRQGLQINLDDREESIREAAPSAGTVVRAFDGVTIHERAVGGFQPGDVEKAARQLGQQARPKAGFPPAPQAALRQDFATPMSVPPESLSAQEKLARCRDLHRRLRGLDPRIVNVRINYSEENEFSVFCARQTDLAQRVQRLNIFVLVFVSDGESMRYNYLSKGGTGGWELLAFSDEELRSLVDSALALLTAGRIEPGEYTIVAAPGVAGTLAHESFGHGVETDMFVKERARAAGYVGRQVGSPLVNILDDPSLPGAYGSYFFDDEGWLAGPTHIVRDGIFQRGLSDQYSAAMLGIPRSANGRRQDFTRKAYARMSNTFFAPGTTPLDSLFAQVENGIYLEQWSSGMEDPQGWGIQITCHYGREIRGGKLTDRMFAPVGVTGYVPDVLASIRAVGQDFAMDTGGCGKGHKEFVSVSSGGPHLLMRARLG